MYTAMLISNNCNKKKNMTEKKLTMKSKPLENFQDISKITLRPIQLSDIDDFMAWATDDRVTQYCIWDTYTSKTQAMDFINNIVMPHPWYRAICVDNRAVGSISVSPNSGSDRCRAELGYVLAYDHWGKGITTKAVKLVVSSIFQECPYLERLEAYVDVNNKGSQRVLEKSGFLREGVLRKYKVVKGICRDTMVFSFVSSDQHLDS